MKSYGAVCLSVFVLFLLLSLIYRRLLWHIRLSHVSINYTDCITVCIVSLVIDVLV